MMMFACYVSSGGDINNRDAGAEIWDNLQSQSASFDVLRCSLRAALKRCFSIWMCWLSVTRFDSALRGRDLHFHYSRAIPARRCGANSWHDCLESWSSRDFPVSSARWKSPGEMLFVRTAVGGVAAAQHPRAGPSVWRNKHLQIPDSPDMWPAFMHRYVLPADFPNLEATGSR